MNNRNSKPNDKSRNGSKPKGRPQSKKDVEEQKFYAKTKGSNALAWHTPDPELLHRTATIPWSFQTGELVDTNRTLVAPLGEWSSSYASVPGFCVLRDVMSVGGFGQWSYGNQPTYTAANSLLTTMRSRTRVRNTYDAPDVMMLMIAVDNIYGTVAWFKRLAATVNMFTYQNHYLPRDIIKAQGVDPDWLMANSYAFVTQLNVIISEINKIYIPSRMHLFELHNSRFSNYYTEGSSIKDQIYFFTPAFLSIIDYNATEDYQSMVKPLLCLPGEWQTDENGRIIGTKYNHDSLVTGDVLLAALRQMLNAIIEHDSTADITGDMENAFGSGDKWVLSMCDPNSVAAPIFDEEILETIHNTSILYGPRALYQNYNTIGQSMPKPYFCVVQDVNTNRIGMWDRYYLQKNNSVRAIVNAEASFNIIDVHKDPSPEKTFEIMRLRSVVSYMTEDDNNIVYDIEFGADVIVNFEVYDYHYVDGVRTVAWHGFDTITPVDGVNDRRKILAIAPFHYSPMLKVTGSNYVATTNAWFLGETDIYSMIPDLDFVENMNRLSLLTLLGAYNNV